MICLYIHRYDIHYRLLRRRSPKNAKRLITSFYLISNINLMTKILHILKMFNPRTLYNFNELKDTAAI